MLLLRTEFSLSHLWQELIVSATVLAQQGAARDAPEVVEAAVEELEGQLGSEDKEALESARDTFAKKAQKLGEILYAQAQAEQPGAPGADAGAASSDDSDEPIDADFEVKS